jgi:tRNA threonylcarbamoyl adenosine modification protein YeaZ
MHYFITIQYPYEYLCVTLSSQNVIIESATITKFQAVGKLIPTIGQLLQKHSLELQNISCIGINTGPGPFNTLRSVIATANGISFAKKIPLIGLNGLQLMLDDYAHQTTVAILDACGNDVYFAIKQTGQMGYTSINNLIEMINALDNQTTYIIGNGIIKHHDILQNQVKGNVESDNNYLFASHESLYQATKINFFSGIQEKELYPLYFESPVTK